jgi:predicted DNA repair protein MutK
MIQGGMMLLAVFGNWLLLPFFLLGCANYLIFAGIPALRGTAMVVESAKRRKRFNSANKTEQQSFHTCVLCDRTEVTDPGLEFRVGHDGREYCAEHLPE